MRRWHWTALIACLAATVTVWMQARTLRTTEAETAAAIAVPGPDPVQLAGKTVAVGSNDFSDEARELARLRNEVTQLRSQKRDLESARRENAELAAAKQHAATAPRPQAPPGFVAREQLANVGYATPDDAVQTFFWAMREGNFDALVGSFSPNSRERQRFDQMTPEQREKMRQKLTSAGHAEFVSQLNDLGIRGRESSSEDSMTLHVGSSLSTNTVRMRLDRTPEGWKFHDPGF